MDRFARTVLAYHGCAPDFADRILSGSTPVADWQPSQNSWDWLGHGIYFWEYAPERALTWRDRSGAGGAVIGAIIQLGNCLDLTDVADVELLAEAFEQVRQLYDLEGIALPSNNRGRNNLDCLVINAASKIAEVKGSPFNTSRCPFLEGDRAYPGSLIYRQSHVQLVVLTPANILGVFRPNLPPNRGRT